MRSAKGRERSANSRSPCVLASVRSALWRRRQRLRNAAVSSGVPNIIVGVDTSRPAARCHGRRQGLARASGRHRRAPKARTASRARAAAFAANDAARPCAIHGHHRRGLRRKRAGTPGGSSGSSAAVPWRQRESRQDRRRARQRRAAFEQSAHGIRGGASLRNSAPPRAASYAARRARIGWGLATVAGPVSRSSLLTASISAWASRAGASPRAMTAKPIGQIGEHRLRHAGAHSSSRERNRFRHLRALCTPLCRSGGVASAPWAISSSANATRRNASLIGIAGSRR